MSEKSKRTEGRTGKDGRICRNCAAGAIYNCKRSAGFKGVSAGQPPGDGKPEDSGGGNRVVIWRYFCGLLLSLPKVYPRPKQVRPKLTTAIKSTILMA